MVSTDYDSALPVRGNVTDGSTAYAENTILVVGGYDGTNYMQIRSDTSGRQIAVGAALDSATAVGAPVLIGGLYEATLSAVSDGEASTIAVDSFGRLYVGGSAADGGAIAGAANPVLIAGSDGTNVQTILTDSSGRVMVVVGGGTKAGIYYDGQTGPAGTGWALLVKDTPTVVNTIVGGAAVVVKRVLVSGSGLMKIEIMEGITGAEVVKFVKYNSTAQPNVEFELFEDGWSIITGNSIVVQCTNLENRASPASDFDGHATIVTEILV